VEAFVEAFAAASAVVFVESVGVVVVAASEEGSAAQLADVTSLTKTFTPIIQDLINKQAECVWTATARRLADSALKLDTVDMNLSPANKSWFET